MSLVEKIVYITIILCLSLQMILSSTITMANSDENIKTEVAEGRTFGHHFLKRMSFALVPGAFVIGVITTLLAALTVVSLKGLGVGVILLILAIGQILSRTVPQVHAATFAVPPPPPAPAALPIVYSHSHTQQPVWLEKEW